MSSDIILAMTEKKEFYPNSSDMLFRELKEVSTQSAVFRWSLRDVLGQIGIPSNPGWSDEEIVANIAEKLGVENRYSQINEEVREIPPREENPQNSGS
jgi:hypothetical protein